MELTVVVFAWDLGGPVPIILGEVTKYTIEKKDKSFNVTLKMIIDVNDKSKVRKRIMDRYDNCEMEEIKE